MGDVAYLGRKALQVSPGGTQVAATTAASQMGDVAAFHALRPCLVHVYISHARHKPPPDFDRRSVGTHRQSLAAER